MKAIYRSNIGRCSARIAVIGAVSMACLFIAYAQAPQPPYALFQNAVLTGSGNAVNATRIPVVTQSGVTIYLDMTLQFNVDANGNLALASGYPQVNASQMLLTSNFKAGTYVGPSTLLNGKEIVAVNGPGIADAGATQWSLSAGSGADPCTTPFSATWYVGSLTGSPYAARLKSAGITSTAWSYGVGGGNGCNANVVGLNPNYWYSGSLLGFSQNGNALTIATFSSGGSTDHNSPQDQVTLSLRP